MYHQAIIVVMGLLLTLVSTVASADWTIRTLDSDGAVGKYCSIAVGNSGETHISYYDSLEKNLKYASNGSGTWEMAVLDSDQGAGQGTSIQVDQNGAAHISYFFNSFQWCESTSRPINSLVRIKYATNASGSWETQDVWGPETCTSSAVRGKSTSLAIDGDGAVHVVSDHPAYEDLVYSSNTSSTWSTQRPELLWRRTQVSLSMDASNNAHIAYYAWGSGLKYLTNRTDTWEDRVLDSIITDSEENCCNWDVSIKTDSRDAAHISYYDTVNGNLKYATNASGTWSTETLDNGADVGRYNALALDANGRMHIAYYDAVNQSLKYGTTVTGTWETQSVDDKGNVGSHTSIAIDRSGGVHICYYDEDRMVLKYAFQQTEDAGPCNDSMDSDGDGIDDCEEQGPDGSDPSYDGNGDGTADYQQSNVASFMAHNNRDYISMASPAGTKIDNCSVKDNPSPTDSPSGVSFSYGFLEFAIKGVDKEDTITVKMHLPAGADVNTYYKFGPTPDNPTYHWYEFLYDGQTGAEIQGDIILLHFVDGLRGDDDLTGEGEITDLGAPGVSGNVPDDVDKGKSNSTNGDDDAEEGCFLGIL